MNWYKTLSIHQRINLKILTVNLCGMPFDFLIKILGFKTTIEALHQKLQLEGFNV